MSCVPLAQQDVRLQPAPSPLPIPPAPSTLLHPLSTLNHAHCDMFLYPTRPLAEPYPKHYRPDPEQLHITENKFVNNSTDIHSLTLPPLHVRSNSDHKKPYRLPPLRIPPLPPLYHAEFHGGRTSLHRLPPLYIPPSPLHQNDCLMTFSKSRHAEIDFRASIYTQDTSGPKLMLDRK